MARELRSHCSGKSAEWMPRSMLGSGQSGHHLPRAGERAVLLGFRGRSWSHLLCGDCSVTRRLGLVQVPSSPAVACSHVPQCRPDAALPFSGAPVSRPCSRWLLSCLGCDQVSVSFFPVCSDKMSQVWEVSWHPPRVWLLGVWEMT